MRHHCCTRRGGGKFLAIFLLLFGGAAVISNVAGNITAPAVWVQLLIGTGAVVAFLGLGYLFVWKG